MRKKLLLADDSITIQKVVELTFSDEFEVVTAGNGRIAVDKALAFLPDVVLCDVIMPQLDGYQVCEALHASEQLRNVPILLLNGAFEPYDAERAKSVGALGNVSKPFDPPALVARVKEILAERGTGSLSRPTQPLAIDAIASLSQAQEDAKTQIPEPAHQYAYDESETHPVSTIEVPMGVRELAARSLSLDAPVFAVPEPEVLNTEPADFAQTLHGPLDAYAPSAIEEAPITASEIEHIEEIESIEEMEPATTAETVPQLPIAAAVESFHEHAEFDPEPDELPNTLPATHAQAPPAHIEEFSGEHEFDPHDLDTPIVQTSQSATDLEPLPSLPEPEPESMPAAVAAEPEMMAVPEPATVAEAEPEPEPVEAPITPSSLETAIGMPAYSRDAVEEPAPFEPPVALPAATAAAVAASSTGLSGLVDLQPEPEPEAPSLAPTPTAANGVPSAEVAVPVDMVQQIAQRVISQVSERVIREIAWDVIPGLAEKLIKAEIERIKARTESERD